MTRLWVGGEPIKMVMDRSGTPALFVWKGKEHPVEKVTNQWRVDVSWWRLRIWREHYKLITKTGLLVILYHDLLQDRWYLQRLYD